MRFMMRSTLVATLAGAWLPAIAQPTRAILDSARRELDVAVNLGDIKRIGAARARIERVATVAPNDAWAHHYIGYSYYREAIFRMQRDSGDPKAQLDLARASLERSITLGPVPETHALLSSVLGQQIGSNPLKGMVLGPKSDGAMEKAMEAGPNNPRVWLLNGIGTLYKPAMFGGGADKAEAQLRKAADLFKTDKPAGLAPPWGHAEVYAWPGQHEVQTNDMATARAM